MKKLRDFISRQGFTTNSLAKATGIPQSGLARFLSGERGLSEENIEVLLDYFSVDFSVPIDAPIVGYEDDYGVIERLGGIPSIEVDEFLQSTEEGWAALLCLHFSECSVSLVAYNDGAKTYLEEAGSLEEFAWRWVRDHWDSVPGEDEDDKVYIVPEIVKLARG